MVTFFSTKAYTHTLPLTFFPCTRVPVKRLSARRYHFPDSNHVMHVFPTSRWCGYQIVALASSHTIANHVGRAEGASFFPELCVLFHQQTLTIISLTRGMRKIFVP